MNDDASLPPHFHHPHAQRGPGGMNRRDFIRWTGLGAAGLALSSPAAKAMSNLTNPTGPGAIRFAVIGDYGETLADQTFPLDRVAEMIRSWSPDFVVTTGDNNYVLGQAETIDVNIGKNFTGYIYPKMDGYDGDYPYPPTAPLYNRFIPVLGNHDYADVADDELPTTSNIAYSDPYLDYFQNALRTGMAMAPNTTINFADNAQGQTYNRATISGDVEDFQAFMEAMNMRFFDVRLGTASGPSSVHLFIFDSNPATPYSRYYEDRQVPNRDGSPSTYTENAAQGKWLQQRLAASTAQWKIVIFHHPPYNSASGAANSQYTMMRWPFQAWGATAVITGHVHNYERLEMPDADPNTMEPIYGNPTIPYMVNGAGGFVPEQGFDPSFVIQGSQVRVAQYGAQLITADEDSINFLYYDIDGVLRDVKTILADEQSGPPQVEFAGREFPVDASAGTVSIPVQRLGDASQPLDVHYATMDGSAIAGVNYTASSGVLHFDADEREQTITVPIDPPPDFNNTVPWQSLTFTIGLTSPDNGTISFFNIASVIMVNTVDTPINNQDLFIVQTYQDILQDNPTNAEIQAARTAIGSLDLWLYRARWVYQLMTDNYTSEPVFPAAQAYALLNLSTVSALASNAAPPSYPDLENGVNLWRGADTTDDALTALSDAFNRNILDLLNAEFSGFATDNSTFISTVYSLVVPPLATGPTDEDTAYWLTQLSDANDSERDRTRNLMLGRIATESFDPPPVSGMTSFDLTDSTNNGNEVNLAIIIAGLMRIQVPYSTFRDSYLIPVRAAETAGGQTGLTLAMVDVIHSALLSPEYAARFSVTSYEGYIDSVKGHLSMANRDALADPELDGKSNFAEYSFALQPGSGEDVTEMEVEDDAGQRYGIFTYRKAQNIRRVEFLIQVSEDMQTWTTLSNPVADGGIDMGSYIKRRIRIPLPPSEAPQFVRVITRPVE